MDEVDFTILAATSVLGDLIEKCPPAEACRDAFNRMSKATVQMCMSTTGFGSSALGLNSGTQVPQSTSDDFGFTPNLQSGSSNTRDHLMSPRQRFPDAQQMSPATQGEAQYGFCLNENFTSDGGLGTPDCNQTQQSYQMPGQANSHDIQSRELKNEFSSIDDFGISAHQIHNQGDHSMLSPEDPSPIETSAIDPSLLPSPQAQQLPQSLASQDASAAMAAAAAVPNLFDPTGFDDLDLDDMDFLMHGGTDGSAAGAVPDGFGPEMDGGLRFGLGWEAPDHDFSEGNNVDLFDGFYFGAPLPVVPKPPRRVA